MALKGNWRPRIDGVDDADSSAVNEIAEAVIELENAMDGINSSLDNIINIQNAYIGETE